MNEWLHIVYKAFWCGCAATGFAVLFNSPVRALVAVFLFGFLAGVVKYLVLLPSVGGGIILASLLAASAVGFLSIPFSHRRHVPPIILSIPAVIPLVPGSLAYRAMLGLIRFIINPESPVITGAIHNGLTAIFIILALVIGATLPMLLFRIESVKHVKLGRVKNPPGNSSKTLIVLVILGVGLLSLFPISLKSQDTTKIIPDGTMGETLEPVDSFAKKKFPKNLNIFNGRFSTFRAGIGFLYEYAGFKQDQVAKDQMDSAGVEAISQFKVRDFRVFFSGQFKTKRVFTWKAGFMYDGPNREWLVRETGFTVGVPELKGHIFIGRTKEGYSLNKVMNGYAGWTMERQMALDVIPILADGIKWIGFLPKQKLLWNVGIYADWLSRGQTFSTYSWQWAARVAWLPINDAAGHNLFHVGLNYRYGKVLDGKIKVRSRPEANPAPFFLDTQEFLTDHSNHFGAEIYYHKGPLMLGSEIHWHAFHSPQNGNPVFNGGDVVLSYMLTKGRRPYSTTSGVYSFVPVKKPVLKGGLGEIELLLRYSNLDLSDGQISGGRFWRITPMINWYMTKNFRWELAYGYGILNRFQMKGATQFFQTRIQIAIL